jgi:hypothetical protein
MNTLAYNEAMRKSHLIAIANYIENNAPEVGMRETRRNYYEGEEEFSVDYETITLDCVRRTAILDTSNFDYYNGTGRSEEVVYDEIAVLYAYNPDTGEELEELVQELNATLC